MFINQINMTRNILTAILLSLFNLILLSAQEQSEKILFGSNLGFSYTNSPALVTNLFSSDSKTFSTSVSIIGGYFITPKFAIGSLIEFNTSNTSYDHSMIAYYNSRNLLISPFIRYYIIPELFGQAQLNIGNSFADYKTLLYNQVSMSDHRNYFNLGYSVGLGFDIKMKNNIYLEPMMIYMSNKLNDTKNSDDFTQSAVYINLGLIVKL